MRDPSGFAQRVDQLDEEDKEHFREERILKKTQ
jgi:hypothetical protein